MGTHQQVWGLSGHNYAEQPLKGSLKDKFSQANQTFFFYLAIIFHLEILGATIPSVLLSYKSTLLKSENPE